MTLRAGFAEIDITPPLPCEKVGWLVRIVAETVRDPLVAHVAVFESGDTRIGFVSLDLLSIRWREVDRIRDAAEKLGIPKDHLMVAATHTHAGPAAVGAGDVKRNDGYIDHVLVPRVTRALQEAVAALQPARIAFARGCEDRVAFNRRFVMTDGSTMCHARDVAKIRCREGATDPQLAVLAATDRNGRYMGTLVNYACHPTHFGGDNTISPGWPGAMGNRLKDHFGPQCVTLFLNGTFGDVHTANPLNPEHADDPQRIGAMLADDVRRLLAAPTWLDDVHLTGRTTTLRLPWRDIDGPFGRDMPHRQRFGTEDIYEREIEQLRLKQSRRDHFPAEVQCLTVGPDCAYVSIPGEPFTELGLRIKADSPFAYTQVVGAANGMVGYIPTRRAFDGGGYECTLITSSCVDVTAADAVVDAALNLLRQ